ncbi:MULTISPECIES: DUF547 domain-containing protein [unclassified Pseudoalteromonas]|uniref:DUF547 domain-containing protein n=1 Tax=unclassified Pseudoalteromonas TaxID=194690 RepID=UPI0025B32DEF|nr:MULTISPECIES: DUF547 domain-containing protein [unclassified Pseudoalteromonas]MDN3379799.1 DUF547 domain-containing protein [Pseudoalteromonas sp. APC 3893]MDN3388075.1 DUF547 domain-containing protein [Pseudoalteromonas sp. APC 4017]
MVLAFIASTTVQAEQKSNAIHQPWNELLNKHVKIINEGVGTQADYTGFKTEQAKLQAYLKTLSQVEKSDFDSWSNATQLAFLINAYNAWTIEFILSEYPNIDSIKELGSFFSSPWSKEFIPLLGEVHSLDNIEHTLIRGENKYNEPRIHFAVNCASIGCPALRAQAYIAPELNKQLEQQTTLFLADKTRNYADGDTLYLSSIFKWYQDDFEKGFADSHSLASFILLYSDAINLNAEQQQLLKSNAMKIEFLDYDWALNDIQ